MDSNEVLRQLKERKSVRAFSDRELAEDTVRAILTAASNAPTADHFTFCIEAEHPLLLPGIRPTPAERLPQRSRKV